MVLAVFWNSYFPNPLLVCPIELNLSLLSKLQFSLKISILLSCLLLRDQTLVICHSCHGHRTWQMNYEVQINRRFLFFLYAASLKLKNHLLRAKKKALFSSVCWSTRGRCRPPTGSSTHSLLTSCTLVKQKINTYWENTQSHFKFCVYVFRVRIGILFRVFFAHLHWISTFMSICYVRQA